MWKYVSRRIRDSFERSANYFDIRGTAGAANTSTNNLDAEKCAKSCLLNTWYFPKKCWNSFQENTTNNKWNFEHLNCSWLGAITWSGGLFIGWYATQLIHLKSKYRHETSSNGEGKNLIESLKPFAEFVNGKDHFQRRNSKSYLYNITPTIKLISNDHSGPDHQEQGNCCAASVDSSGSDLGEVLNTIENRLGLSAIENGQHQDGLNLLRSAAHRNHAPALYNLGLCYELGLGVKQDEKMSMELYRSAAMLHHPGALYNLGIYYGQGRGGLSRDTATATRLLRLAAVKGQADAIEALKSLDVPPIEEKEVPSQTWVYPYSPYTQSDDIMPAQASLFIHSINANFQSSVY